MIIRDNNYKSCTDGATHGAPERISPTPRRGPQLGLRPQRRGEEQRGGTAAARPQFSRQQQARSHQQVRGAYNSKRCQPSLTCLPHSRLGPGPAPRPAAARLRAGDRGSSFRGQRRWRRPASPARTKLRTIKSIYFLRLWFCQFSIQLS